MTEARRFVVKGRVQGVFFRDSTRNVANSLQITGHAINLPDGTVEVLACGSAAALDELARWLREGPPLANVTDVATDTVEPQVTAEFSVG